MISFWSSVVRSAICWTAEPAALTIVAESSGLVCLPVRAGSIGSARAAAFARCDLGGEHPPGDRLAAPQLPGRGVAPTTMPNQRPRISQPSIRTSTPVSSSRHNSHRSSLCTMPATAARWGRAPASRRAAIRTSAGVRTLTTPAWARAALDDHRGRGPRKASHATATASARHRRATASGRRKCRISRLQFRA